MITIGIPVYKRTKYIREVLTRCISQTYDNFEILISDSSPDDEIRKIVGEFDSARIRYMRKPSEITLMEKLNDLILSAHGDYMLFLCDDDQIETEYLRTMDALISTYPEATLYRCRYRLIDGEGTLLRLDRKSPAYMSPPDFLRHVFLPEKDFFKMNITGIIFPRELFLKKGAIPMLPTSWHSDRLSWAILAAEGGCAYEERALCSVRLHAGSISSSFGSDLMSSLETDLKTKKIGRKLIENVGERYRTSADKQILDEASRNLDTYMQRHLSRSLDHGFLAHLAVKNKTAHSQTKNLFSRMRDLEVDTFRSTRVYYLLSMLPDGIRLPLVNAVKQYKVKKWTT